MILILRLLKNRNEKNTKVLQTDGMTVSVKACTQDRVRRTDKTIVYGANNSLDQKEKGEKLQRYTSFL